MSRGKYIVIGEGRGFGVGGSGARGRGVERWGLGG